MPRVDTTLLTAVLGLTALGIAIRFSTVGLQSYHHDEVVTAARVLPGSFGHLLHEIRASESTPPLYYVLAWGWSKIFGTGEAGLRSLSALFGAMTIPLAYLIGREVWDRRAGVIATAMVAVNPMLIWYSQEARAYALLVLLCAASLLFFLRARRSGRAADLGLWALFSALALCTHYFAAFPIAVEAIWLLALFRRDRETLLSVAAVGAAGLLLAPLALAQANPHHIGWISSSPMLVRITDTAANFMIGETGQIIAEPPRDGYAIFPGALVLIGLAVAVWPARRRHRDAIFPTLLIGCGTILIAILVALAGSDYVIGRNLLPALVPLLAVSAAGLALIRPAKLGVVLVVALCAYWLAFDVYVDAKPSFQRPDVRALAQEIGAAKGPRVIIAWKLAGDGLQYYLHDGTAHVWGGPQEVSEVDAIVKQKVAHHLGPRPPGLPHAFRRVQQVREGRMTLVRYRAPNPQVVLFSKLKDFKTGFGVNVVLANAGAAAPPATSPEYVGGSLRR
jgi:mannosyltransferase